MATQGELDTSLLERFFRSGLFPLIAIVLLVYLASQTLTDQADVPRDVFYSALVLQVESEPPGVRKVVFKPNRHEIEAELVGGELITTTYPTPHAQQLLEDRLSATGVAYNFDWSEPRESAWWPFLTVLLPFVLLFGFWNFLTRQRRDERPPTV